jgi:hypothetical protein
MGIWAKLVERRKHKRFQLPKGVFVGIGPENTQVGRLRDLSMGGLAFSYVGSEQASNGSYLDIFFTDNDFYLGHLPFKTISDYEVVEKLPSGSATLRRRAVKFGKMTRSQKSQLAHIIQNQAVGEA